MQYLCHGLQIYLELKQIKFNYSILNLNIDLSVFLTFYGCISIKATFIKVSSSYKKVTSFLDNFAHIEYHILKLH